MTDQEYEKALLLARIDAHRSIVGLEVRLARANFDPLGAALAFLGADGGLATTIVSSVHGAFGRSHEGGFRGFVPLLVAALLPLVEGLRSGASTTAPEEPATAHHDDVANAEH